MYYYGSNRFVFLQEHNMFNIYVGHRTNRTSYRTYKQDQVYKYCLSLIYDEFGQVWHGIHLFHIVTVDMELAVEKRRNLMAILLTFNWPVGGVIAGLLGYLIRDWRLLHAYSVIPALLSIPLSFLLPESPRCNFFSDTTCQRVSRKQTLFTSNQSGADPTPTTELQRLSVVIDHWSPKERFSSRLFVGKRVLFRGQKQTNSKRQTLKEAFVGLSLQNAFKQICAFRVKK